MGKLSIKLAGIINEQDFCFTPEEMCTVRKALARFRAYEDTEMLPEEVSEYQTLCRLYVEAGLDAKLVQTCIDAVESGITVEDIRDLVRAKKVNSQRRENGGATITVQEYNSDFLPRIDRAREFVSLFESSINHMDGSRVDKDEVRKQFAIRCWSEETKQTILTALSCYKRHEGLDKIESNDFEPITHFFKD